MKGLSAHEAKRAAKSESRPSGRIEFKYTVDGQQYTFSELMAAVQAKNPSISESKIRARLSRNHRTMAALTIDNLPHHRPMSMRGKFK